MDFETQAAGSRLEKGSSVSRFWCGIATGIDLFDEASYIYNIISFICKFCTQPLSCAPPYSRMFIDLRTKEDQIRILVFCAL